MIGVVPCAVVSATIHSIARSTSCTITIIHITGTIIHTTTHTIRTITHTIHTTIHTTHTIIHTTTTPPPLYRHLLQKQRHQPDSACQTPLAPTRERREEEKENCEPERRREAGRERQGAAVSTRSRETRCERSLKTNSVVTREHGGREAHQKRQLGETVNGVLEEKTDGAEGRTKERVLLVTLIEFGNLFGRSLRQRREATKHERGREERSHCSQEKTVRNVEVFEVEWREETR